MSHSLLRIAPEVADALAAGRPIVAFESTIVTHGMPFPANVETARSLEAIVRAAGCAPATIAVMDGKICVGLDATTLECLGRARNAKKLSRADLAHALTQGLTGSTTVAATMIAADLAGIRVFATGGIGGVHRGAETTFDVSADLQELARTPVTVVCAGAKAILDLPKTFEVLETLGVPVVGFRTDEIAAFWSRTSGLPAPLQLNTGAQVAAMIAIREALGLTGGVLVVTPVPAEYEIPAGEIAGAIEAALGEAAKAGVSGKAVTPFLLDRVLVLTAGRSLTTNVALIENNARVAAEIAVAMARG